MSMSISKLSHLVPQLDSSNYSMWKVKMEMLLIRERLWSIVSEQRTAPTAPAPLSATSGSHVRERNTVELSSERIQWEEDAERATATIFLHLSDCAQKHVLTLRDPVAIWKKFRDIYEMRGFSTRFYIWQKLFTLRPANYRNHQDKAIEMYIDECRSYCQQLRSSGATVANEIEASVLLNGLNQGFESFIIATTQSLHQNNNDSDINVDDLISQLIDEDRRRTHLEPAGEHTALAAYSMNKRRRIECQHCHKGGHSSIDCWKLHLEKRKEAANRAYAYAARIAEDIPSPDRIVFTSVL